MSEMLDSTNFTCQAVTCTILEDSRYLGSAVLVVSIIFIIICCVNWFAIVKEKLGEAFPVYYLIISQQIADLANIIFYFYVALCLINRDWLFFSTMDGAILVGYFEAYVYSCQLLHHLAVALIRLLLSFSKHMSGSFQMFLKSKKCNFIVIAITWSLNLLLTIFLHATLHCELYYDVRYGYLTFATPEIVDTDLYLLYWSVLEIGCVLTSIVIYLVIFVNLTLQRRSHQQPEKENRQTTSQRKQEMNILYMCAVNVTVALANSLSWRMVSYFFHITDMVNSVASAALSLVMIGRIRNRVLMIMGCDKKEGASTVVEMTRTRARPKQA